MKELAKALASAPGMKDVLEALDQNKLADAAKALEEAAKKAAEKPEAAASSRCRRLCSRRPSGWRSSGNSPRSCKS